MTDEEFIEEMRKRSKLCNIPASEITDVDEWFEELDKELIRIEAQINEELASDHE